MSFPDLAFILLGGIVTGFIGSMFGIGGGIFLIPFLVLVFHVPMHVAIATSIIAVIATSSAAASVFVERHQANIRLGMMLEITTTIGAVLGGVTAIYLSGDALRKIFSVLLVVMGSIMWYRSRAHGDARIEFIANKHLNGHFYDDASRKEIAYSIRRLPVAQVVSFLAGHISGLLGVGGGIMKVPVMNLFCGVPMKAATATSNFMIGVTAVASAFIYFSRGHVDPLITSAAALGVLGGSLIGTRVGKKIQSKTIIGLFALLLLAIAVRLFFQ